MIALIKKLIPNFKPQIGEKEILKILEKNKIDLEKNPVALVGIRGYYKNTMGEINKNDRGIYDDALVWVIRGRGIMAFNGNCDASKYRKGKGKGAEKGMASLNCGVWEYKTGIHNGSKPHAAFRQYKEVCVTRDGVNGNYQDGPGFFGINIHRGGASGTSSLGCQTIPTNQWKAFKELGYGAIAEHGLEFFPYVLIEN